MKYGSICSGIEAASAAWEHLGWSPAFFSEIDKFPSAVLAHHYGSNMPGDPVTGNGVPNYGDMTQFEGWPDHAIDVLVGGTPCQDYSVAGLRAGMAGARGSLTLDFIRIAARYRPEWVVWENVPGVLSSNKGRDFARFLGDLSGTKINVPEGGWKNSGVVAGIGDAYGLAYRVLDAQFVRVDGMERAVPQRRRRVFVVGYIGDWRRAAAVLFEPESLRWHSAPRREAGEGFAACAGKGAKGGSHWDGSGVHPSLNQSHNTGGIGASNQEVFSQRGAGLVPGVGSCGADDNQAQAGHLIASTGDVSHCLNAGAMGRIDYETETMIAFSSKDHGADATVDCSSTLRAGGHSGSHANAGVPPAAAFDLRGREGGAQFEGPHDAENIRAASGGSSRSYVQQEWAVRRLMPVECERLQGFPDGYTAIEWRGKAADDCPDGPRYKALGNSMAVNVMRWIGRRIEMVDKMTEGTQ